MLLEEKKALVESVPTWFHSIDFGDGVVSRGTKSVDQLAGELGALSLPDLTGKTVLDIGAWDGFFSFACEAKGASRVLALDHFAWHARFEAVAADVHRRLEAKRAPIHPQRVVGGWDFGSVPGKKGFDVAHRILGSYVEHYVGDFLKVDPDAIGSFDVVLFLGVLYHMENPLGALRRLALLTRELAVIETEMTYFPGLEETGVLRSFGGAELDADPTNWFSPNRKALLDLCMAAGFRSVEILHGYPPAPADEGSPDSNQPVRARCTIHAYR